MQNITSQPSPKPTMTRLQPSTEVNSSLLVAEYSADEKAAVLGQLSACQAVQRTYGKQAGDVAAVAKIFFSDFQHYSAKEVAQAIAQWRMESPEFPTPADIRRIIMPERRYDKSVYLALKKRVQNDDFMMPKELEYIRNYENDAIRQGAC